MVWWVAFSPDGKQIATAGEDAPGQALGRLGRRATLTLASDAGEVRCVAFSPDGKSLAGATEVRPAAADLPMVWWWDHRDPTIWSRDRVG